jgi:DNA-binding transcriptional ArsR family regulator
MSVGEIVTAMGLAQSTVSQHLKILAEVRFVLVEPVGNARHYRIDEACVECFPSAADVVMGKPAPPPATTGRSADDRPVHHRITVRHHPGCDDPAHANRGRRRRLERRSPTIT